MANFEQWAGFKGRKWTHSVDVRDFIHMKVMSHSLRDQQKQQTNYGEDCRSFRKKKELRAEFLTWRQRLFPV